MVKNNSDKKSLTTIISCRVPQDYFVTKGAGESDIQVHAGSFHLALNEAGIAPYNIVTYSSIMPSIAQEIKQPKLVHGSVLESIIAVANSKKGKRATAAIIYGWLHNRKTKKRYGGLVCEYNGGLSEFHAGLSLHKSLNELYTNGFEEEHTLEDIRLMTKSIIPKKKYGTAIVAIGFVNFMVRYDKVKIIE